MTITPLMFPSTVDVPTHLRSQELQEECTSELSSIIRSVLERRCDLHGDALENGLLGALNDIRSRLNPDEQSMLTHTITMIETIRSLAEYPESTQNPSVDAAERRFTKQVIVETLSQILGIASEGNPVSHTQSGGLMGHLLNSAIELFIAYRSALNIHDPAIMERALETSKAICQSTMDTTLRSESDTMQTIFSKQTFLPELALSVYSGEDLMLFDLASQRVSLDRACEVFSKLAALRIELGRAVTIEDFYEYHSQFEPCEWLALEAVFMLRQEAGIRVADKTSAMSMITHCFLRHLQSDDEELRQAVRLEIFPVQLALQKRLLQQLGLEWCLNLQLAAEVNTMNMAAILTVEECSAYLECAHRIPLELRVRAIEAGFHTPADPLYDTALIVRKLANEEFKIKQAAANDPSRLMAEWASIKRQKEVIGPEHWPSYRQILSISYSAMMRAQRLLPEQ